MRGNPAFVLLVATLSACAQQTTHASMPPSHLQTLFDRGRLHRYWPWETQASFGLVALAPEIVAIESLGASPNAAWLRFDANQMHELAYDELSLQLPLLADSYGSLLGDLKPEEWLPLAKFERRDATRLTLSYQRVVANLIVRDNILQFIFNETAAGKFRLIEIVSNSAGPTPQHLPIPKVKPDTEWLMDLTGRSDLTLLQTKLEWIPFLEAEKFDWRLAMVFDWAMDGLNYRASLDVDSQSWLDAYPQEVHAKPMLSKVLERNYAEAGVRSYPLSFAVVHGPEGNFDLGAEGLIPEGFVPNQISLSGARAMVLDMQSPNQISYAGLEEKPSSFFLTEDPARLAAVNAFVSVQRINRFSRQFLNSSDAAFLNQALLINVNMGEQSCNAYYSPRQQRILLYKEGGGCANMALINDVVYHEWGHALDDHLGIVPGIVDAAFSEGIADVIAAFYNNDPDIAPHFVVGNPNPLRSIENTRMYPRDIGQMHYEGGIISGAFWDLRLALIARYGSVRGAYLAGWYFFRHLLGVDSYNESYAAVLRLDDEDGNPATQSPNYCLINSAFAKHGLATEDVCHDPLVAPPEAVSQELFAAFLDSGPEANGVHLLTSAPEASTMAYCWGSQKTCQASRETWVALDKIGSQVDRSFFRSAKPLLLPDLASLVLFSIDESGHISGSRELKVFAK